MIEFQHTATRRWLQKHCNIKMPHFVFQHTATRRWLLYCDVVKEMPNNSFNTQPPEGGCSAKGGIVSMTVRFQHTATRRWLRRQPKCFKTSTTVSTHSHPKVAAYGNTDLEYYAVVSTHSHPKVAASAIIENLAS